MKLRRSILTPVSYLEALVGARSGHGTGLAQDVGAARPPPPPAPPRSIPASAPTAPTPAAYVPASMSAATAPAATLPATAPALTAAAFLCELLDGSRIGRHRLFRNRWRGNCRLPRNCGYDTPDQEGEKRSAVHRHLHGAPTQLRGSAVCSRRADAPEPDVWRRRVPPP